MKSKKKVLVTLLCAALLVFASVMGTLAFLQSQTAVATNTFTVGYVTATLDETAVDQYGDPIEGKDPVTENNYKLVPNHTYVKDPTIHITKGSEEVYVFVEVANGIADIEAGTTIAKQMENNGWIHLEENVYYLNDTVDASTADDDIDVPVFGSFTVAADKDVSKYGDAEITVLGYAVQTDGFADAKAAWNATYGADE